MKYSQAKRHFISRITISKNLTLRKIVTLLSIIYLSIIITRTSKYKRIERKGKKISGSKLAEWNTECFRMFPDPKGVKLSLVGRVG